MKRKMHNSHDLPGNLVTECEKCDALIKENKELKAKIKNIEKLADWYSSNLNSSISAHRIRQALEGHAPK